MDPDLGAGVELTPTCWGMHVDLVEEKPGQPHLTAGCTITAIDGHNLLGLANEDPKKSEVGCFHGTYGDHLRWRNRGFYGH